MHTSSRRAFAIGLAGMFALPSAAGAQSSPVTVLVDANPVAFDQPPIEQAGRVFVPLRGVFERLGASVVFDRGRMNATRGSTTISLTVGSTRALVDGEERVLERAPFLMGGRVFVPLRFVSQGLGAKVSFDRTTRTVEIAVPHARRRTL